jgi:hypothetical protein
MYGTHDQLPRLNQAMTAVRGFLRREPCLHMAVQAAYIAWACGWEAEDPNVMIGQALRRDPASVDVCAVLAGPLGQAALAALAFEFPAAPILFELLPPVAQLICAERRRDKNVAVGVGALAAGVGLILYALSGKKAA